MSVTISLAKAGAVASTALLMGAYVWFQGKGGGPEVLSDTTTGQAVSRPVGSQPETLPGSKSALTDLIPLVDMIDGKPVVFPGSKDAPIFTPGTVVFPGSKSDGVFDPIKPDKQGPSILPGSKFTRVQILPKDGGKQVGSRPAKPAAPPAILSGSKSKAPLIPSPKKKDPLTVLPGSKVRVPLVPAPAPTTKPGEITVLPGSKYFIVPVLPPTQPKTVPNAPIANGENPGKQTKPTSPTVLPGSKAPSSLLKIDPAILKKEKNPKEEATPPTKPTVLPGSKSLSGILDRETIERALERTRKNDQKQAPVEEQKQK